MPFLTQLFAAKRKRVKGIEPSPKAWENQLDSLATREKQGNLQFSWVKSAHPVHAISACF
ncbi:MAG: hypothetical protein JSS49_05280 [Planctomycetes bacterium]|nr:hypothetical protein [Planctomycetota bacterium]